MKGPFLPAPTEQTQADRWRSAGERLMRIIDRSPLGGPPGRLRSPFTGLHSVKVSHAQTAIAVRLQLQFRICTQVEAIRPRGICMIVVDPDLN
jgi:hypothetical protein